MDLYVLGAGASAPYGVPTMNGFVRKMFEPWTLTPPNSTSYDQELSVVARYIDSQYGSNLEEKWCRREPLSPEAAVLLQKINVETLLASARQQSRFALERAIYETLEGSVNDGSSHNEYDNLLKLILSSKRGNCLISFNYDLLLDRALVDASHNQSFSWNYGLPFKAGIINFNSYREEITSPTILLLKLHGSLNWCECLNCGSLRLYFFNTYENIFKTTWPPCKACSSSSGFRPVLIAPAQRKHVPRPLKRAWKLAENYLQATQRIVVVGYSFSPFDQDARKLFLKSLIVPNLFKANCPKLVIVDRNEVTRHSIRSLFECSVNQDMEEYSSFGEFCKAMAQQ